MPERGAALIAGVERPPPVEARGARLVRGKASGLSGMPLLRQKLFPGEIKFFNENPDVAGMAADDDKVIFNPDSGLSQSELSALYKNETTRIFLRQGRFHMPEFDLTEKQKAFLGGGSYADASASNRKATIAARILSGDPSAGVPTPEQRTYVEELKEAIATSPSWWRSPVKKPPVR
jgi:hypothetical protein